VRFALPVSLCVALLLAVSIECWWEMAVHRWPAASRRRSRALPGVIGLTLVSLAPLLATYSLPLVVTTATVPTWFASDASHLAQGTAVLTFPFAYGVESQPMAWQAETRDAFDLVGGWAFVPGGDGVHDEIISPLGDPVSALQALGTDPLGVTTSEQRVVRAALVRWRPVAVVVIPSDAVTGTTYAVTATLGLSPRWTDGAWVWDLKRATRLGTLSPVVR
jgi:hypothetical protein